MTTTIDQMIEVTLEQQDDFLKVRETLTRIGIASRKDKTLFQSCHVLHKQGRYYIVHFKELFEPQSDPQDVVIDFKDSRVWDSSGVDAIDGLADKYETLGKKLHIRHISPECRELMTKAQEYVEMNLN